MVRYRLPSDIRHLHNVIEDTGVYEYIQIDWGNDRYVPVFCDILHQDVDRCYYRVKAYFPNGDVVCGWMPQGFQPEIHNRDELFDGRFNA